MLEPRRLQLRLPEKQGHTLSRHSISPKPPSSAFTFPFYLFFPLAEAVVPPSPYNRKGKRRITTAKRLPQKETTRPKETGRIRTVESLHRKLKTHTQKWGEENGTRRTKYRLQHQARLWRKEKKCGSLVEFFGRVPMRHADREGGRSRPSIVVPRRQNTSATENYRSMWWKWGRSVNA